MQQCTAELDVAVNNGRTANEQLQKLRGEASVLQLWQHNVQAERTAEIETVRSAKQVSKVSPQGALRMKHSFTFDLNSSGPGHMVLVLGLKLISCQCHGCPDMIELFKIELLHKPDHASRLCQSDVQPGLCKFSLCRK